MIDHYATYMSVERQRWKEVEGRQIVTSSIMKCTFRSMSRHGSVTMLGKVKLSPPEQKQKKSITSQCDNKSEDLIFKHAQCETRAERLSAQPVLKL